MKIEKVNRIIRRREAAGNFRGGGVDIQILKGRFAIFSKSKECVPKGAAFIENFQQFYT